MGDLEVYATLFAATFLAATILPFQSEFVFAAYLAVGLQPWPMLWLVATVGNVLGSVVNWAIGRFLTEFRDRWWFPAKGRAFERAHGWYERWGKWSLLMSWAPFMDPLTFIAGLLRVGLPTFLVLVTLGKGGRYLVVVALTLWLS